MGGLQRQQLPGESRPGDDDTHRNQTARRDYSAASTLPLMIWYVNSSQGDGRYNPASGEIKEWPSPSGPKSHPYAIVVVNGIVCTTSQARDRTHWSVLIQKPKIPELADSIGWSLCRHHQAHGGNPGGESADSPEQHQPHHAGDALKPQIAVQ